MRTAGWIACAGLPGCAILPAACTSLPGPAPAPAHTAPPELTAPYATAAESGAEVYRLDPDASQVLVFVGKTGALSGFGHGHVIRVGGLRGFALIEQNGQARADLLFPVSSLDVDPPATRKALGAPWSKHPPDSKARRGTRHNMLGPDDLDATHDPRVHLVARASLSPQASKTSAEMTITLHGVTRTLTTPIDLHRSSCILSARGQFKIRQTDFDIVPYSALLGALRVKNTLRIRYHLIMKSWRPSRPRTPAPQGNRIPEQPRRCSNSFGR